VWGGEVWSNETPLTVKDLIIKRRRSLPHILARIMLMLSAEEREALRQTGPLQQARAHQPPSPPPFPAAPTPQVS
jgi:hypothetical protein